MEYEVDRSFELVEQYDLDRSFELVDEYENAIWIRRSPCFLGPL